MSVNANVRMMVLAGAALCAVNLGGCATVVRGTNATMKIDTVPPGASVTTDLPAKRGRPSFRGCEATPCKFEVPRKSDFLMTVSRDGYDDVRIGVISRGRTEKLEQDMSSGDVVEDVASKSANILSVPVSMGVIAAAAKPGYAGLGAFVGMVGGAGIGVVGLGVDAASGAMLSPNPNPVTISLPPEGSDLPEHPTVERLEVWRMEGKDGRLARKAYKRAEKAARKAARKEARRNAKLRRAEMDGAG